jgi:hypothetical protein
VPRSYPLKFVGGPKSVGLRQARGPSRAGVNLLRSTDHPGSPPHASLSCKLRSGVARPALSLQFCSSAARLWWMSRSVRRPVYVTPQGRGSNGATSIHTQLLFFSHRVCLVPRKGVKKKYCSTFWFYLVNSVQPLTN